MESGKLWDARQGTASARAIEFQVIASQFSFLAWQSPSIEESGLDDEGDSHTRKANWFGMTRILERGLLYGLPTALYFQSSRSDTLTFNFQLSTFNLSEADKFLFIRLLYKSD